MRTSKWTQSQINLLLEKAKDGNVRMHAFEEIARTTGRKPNSVRNFYYKLISSGNPVAGHKKQKFAPFNAADTSRLLREIVLGASRGESVRSVCLKMSAGNKMKMLRLQNKYRAILAKKPKRIEDTVQLLRDQGYLVTSPIRNKVGRLPKIKSTESNSSFRDRETAGKDNVIFMPDNKKKLTDTDINNLFMGLVRLIKRDASEEQTLGLKQQITLLKAEIESLKKTKGETIGK